VRPPEGPVGDISGGATVCARPPPLRGRPPVGRGTTTATQPPRRVTWRPRPSHGDPPWGGGSGPAHRVGADPRPPPPRIPAPKGLSGSGDVASHAAHPRDTPHIGIVGAVIPPNRGSIPPHPHPPQQGCPGAAHQPKPSWFRETCGRASPLRTSVQPTTSPAPRRDPLPPHPRVTTPRGVRRPLPPSTPRRAAPPSPTAWRPSLPLSV